MPTSVNLEPFLIARDIDTRLTDVFDPTNEEHLQWRQEESEDDATTVRVIGETWEKLSITLTATMPESSLHAVLPRDADPGESTTLLLSVRCSASRVREVVRATADRTGRWTATVLINREDVHTTVEIRPRLVRTTRAPSNEPGIATEYAAIIGEGRSIRIFADERAFNMGGSFRVSWENFTTTEHPWRRSHPDDVFHLDVSADSPSLVLNSRYSSLRAALHSTKTKGVDAVIRHLANGFIAQTVWFQLFMAAVAAIRIDEDTDAVEEPTSAWQTAVLRKFLPRIYPTDTTDERLKKAARVTRDATLAATFLSMAGSAVQDQVKAFRLIEHAERAGARLAISEG